MSRCEACGGDGQIEVGAYRGDESDTTTRECRLCGGVAQIAQTPVSDSVKTAARALTQLGQAAVDAGDLMRTRSGNVYIRQYEQRKRALRIAREAVEAKRIKFERTTSDRNADEEMNKFLRDNFQD